MPEKRNANDPIGRNFKAMLYANKVANEILSAGSGRLRHRIVSLFVSQKLSPAAIVEKLNGEIDWREGVSIFTKAGVIRRVIRELVDKTLRRKIQNERWGEQLMRIQDTAHKKRAEWMREHGMHVWTPEEQAHFNDLMQQQNMRWGSSGTRLKHAAIAEAMNERFSVTIFTPEICRRRYLYMRNGKAMMEKRKKRKMLAS